jgi:hypothetical protein
VCFTTSDIFAPSDFLSGKLKENHKEEPCHVNEGNLRTIWKTPFSSKCLKNILGDYILPIIDKYIDPGQCGGLKKSSTSHYLIKLLDFAHKTLDETTPHCAVLCTEDLSKAYNRGAHNLVIEDLHAMHVPGGSLF